MLGMAFILGPALGGGIAAAIDKRAALFAPVALAVITFILAFFKVSETRKEGGILGFPPPGVQQLQAKLIPRGNAPAGQVLSDKVPTTVYVCAVGMFFAAFGFTTMTSMTAFVWVALFNYGATELGIFLTVVGVIGLLVNVFGVKILVGKFGGPKVILTATTLLAIGVGGFTFIENIYGHVVFFLFTLLIGYNFQMPVLLVLVGEVVNNPALRGKATGMVAAGMSLGMGLCPFISGPLFESNVLTVSHMYGSFSHVIFLIGAGVVAMQLVLFVYFIGTGRHPKESNEKAKTVEEAPLDTLVVETEEQTAVGA
jgi:MFS family permease